MTGNNLVTSSFTFSLWGRTGFDLV